MAFFNLTQLGPQNLFKTASTCRADPPAATPQPQVQSERPEATKDGASKCSRVETGGVDEAGSSTTPQHRESTGRGVRVTATGTTPSTSKLATLCSSEI